MHNKLQLVFLITLCIVVMAPCTAYTQLTSVTYADSGTNYTALMNFHTYNETYWKVQDVSYFTMEGTKGYVNGGSIALSGTCTAQMYKSGTTYGYFGIDYSFPGRTAATGGAWSITGTKINYTASTASADYEFDDSATYSIDWNCPFTTWDLVLAGSGSHTGVNTTAGSVHMTTNGGNLAAGTYKTYTGTAINPPDAGYLTTASTCYNTGEAFTVTQNSGSGTEPITYTWTLYDGETPLQTQEYTGSSGLEHTFDALWVTGDYGVQLDVHNVAGDDFVYIEDFINVSQVCLYNETNITPLVIPTMGFQNITLINKTYYREEINGTLIGNITAPVLDFVDDIGDSITGFMQQVMGYMTFPLTLLLDALLTVHTIFVEVITPIIEYASIPIQITNRVIGVMPWQLVGLITLGLSLDLMYLILRGK